MRHHTNRQRVVAASIGAVFFWTAILTVHQPQGPHPGLRDDALKKALKKDWNHEPLSYLSARKALFDTIDGNGRKTECVYTGEVISYLGQPLPNNANVEHTYPESRVPRAALSDLHHLYPVIPEANVARLNLHYGKVFAAVWSRGGSKSGASTKARPVFEVRPERRGDVARSMFYISTMYQVEIPTDEERILKKWHEEDKVSAEEKRRNKRVASKQKSKNPFIDHPGLVDRISDF